MTVALPWLSNLAPHIPRIASAIIGRVAVQDFRPATGSRQSDAIVRPEFRSEMQDYQEPVLRIARLTYERQHTVQAV